MSPVCYAIRYRYTCHRRRKFAMRRFLFRSSLMGEGARVSLGHFGPTYKEHAARGTPAAPRVCVLVGGHGVDEAAVSTQHSAGGPLRFGCCVRHPPLLITYVCTSAPVRLSFSGHRVSHTPLTSSLPNIVPVEHSSAGLPAIVPVESLWHRWDQPVWQCAE